MNMNLENVTIGQVIAIFVVLEAIGKGIGWLLTPYKRRQEKDKTIVDRIKEAEQHLDNDNKRLTTLEADTKQILWAVNALLGHAIDNNHTGEMAKAKEELDKYLIKR